MTWGFLGWKSLTGTGLNLSILHATRNTCVPMMPYSYFEDIKQIDSYLYVRDFIDSRKLSEPENRKKRAEKSKEQAKQ